MTLISNPENYKKLLFQYQSQPITTEEDNEKALAIVEELMHRKNRSLEENELYDLLIVLIEKFEQEFYYTQNSNPYSMLLFLMEQQGITKTELGKVFESLEIAADLVEGKREITQEYAQILGRFFQVEPSLFI
ncbi:putative transcription regulator with HTH domain [Gloeothece citriformis PCC 7424]|uniref:Putative transcription regulator with HTH domain n=1 Tax=Gloeothece citriformis (strain PCC 7424) TaxID=65393 RepID=B7KKN6_GLOC7|nr:hypothetical protein [Gloeothece citriformis]ACK71005.1 putative transcription regulator with HTH domain [Gloeothece citriformis PCC 7424]